MAFSGRFNFNFSFVISIVRLKILMKSKCFLFGMPITIDSVNERE
jgi:hypothetical protein